MKIDKLLEDNDIRLKKSELVKVIGANEKSMKYLVELAFSRNMPVCWRAAWVMDAIAEEQASLADQYITRIWKELCLKHPDGVTRSALRMLTRYDIPEDDQGQAADICLEWLEKESVPVAIKAHAMTILMKLARIYPELKDEFITILEHQVPNNSIGFKARANHIIKDLKKM